jgi:hypothetical protein
MLNTTLGTSDSVSYVLALSLKQLSAAFVRKRTKGKV